MFFNADLAPTLRKLSRDKRHPVCVMCRCSRKVDACGTSPERGYTDDYVPSRTTSLDEQYDTDLIKGNDTDFIDTMNSVDCSLFMGEFACSKNRPSG